MSMPGKEGGVRQWQVRGGGGDMSVPGKAVWVGGGNTSMPGKGGGDYVNAR